MKETTASFEKLVFKCRGFRWL